MDVLGYYKVLDSAGKPKVQPTVLWKKDPQSEVLTSFHQLQSNVLLRAAPYHPNQTPHQAYTYHINISTMLEPLPSLFLFILPDPELQKPIIKQLQLDANLQPKQLEPTIPNQTPAVMDFVHCYPTHLH